jgi:hypothetical protein
MERVITNELTKILILLAAGVAALAALTVNLISKAKGSFKPYQKATLLYGVVGILFFSIIALAAYPPIAGRPFTMLIICQAWFLLLGTLHFYTMGQYLGWAGDRKSFLAETVFTILVGLFGAIGFLLVYHFVSHDGLQFVMAGSILFFLLPFLLFHTFRSAVAIPPKIVKEWFYPVNEYVDEPEDSKMRNLRVISFEFQKRTNDPHFTNFRAKAPADMDFGDLFYYFINDYNDRHSNSRIEIADHHGAPHGWIFYKKSRWFTVVTNYIDAEKTILNNKIKENDVIICTRSVNS